MAPCKGRSRPGRCSSSTRANGTRIARTSIHRPIWSSPGYLGCAAASGACAAADGLAQEDDLEGSGIDLRRRFAAWAAIEIELPAGVSGANLFARDAFVLAVVDLAKQRGQTRMGVARELGRANGALERAGQDLVESHACEPVAECPCLGFAGGGQGEVGAPRVTPVEAPLRLAVAGEIDFERQAGLPIISGRPDRSERLALSMTAPARTRWPGRMQTNPTAAWPPVGLSASLTADSTRLAACAVPATSVSGRMASSCGGVRPRTPGVSTSRTVPASAAAIVLSASSAVPTPLASTRRTPRLRW